MNFIAQQALARARQLVQARPLPKRAKKLWSSEEEERLSRLYADTPMLELIDIFGRPADAIYRKAAYLNLKRSDEYMASEHACRLRAADNPGIEFRFQKGQKPWNSGLKGLPSVGRMSETQFKKGSKPKTWLPIGSERVSRDGYLQRKVTDTGYTPRDWVGIHILNWEERNGPVPAGHCVCFLDGNKQHTEVENLELITRAERMRRNSIHRYPPELKSTIRQLGKLKRAISEATHEKQDD